MLVSLWGSSPSQSSRKLPAYTDGWLATPTVQVLGIVPMPAPNSELGEKKSKKPDFGGRGFSTAGGRSAAQHAADKRAAAAMILIDTFPYVGKNEGLRLTVEFLVGSSLSN